VFSVDGPVETLIQIKFIENVSKLSPKKEGKSEAQGRLATSLSSGK